MLKRFFAVLFGALLICGSFCGCGGPSDEEVIADLGEKFMVAMYAGNDAMAKEICNATGYETYVAMRDLISMASLGLMDVLAEGQNLEEMVYAKVNTVRVKKLSETRGVAVVLDTIGDEPAEYSIPVEKDADGEWKVAVTKAAFN